MPRFLYRRVLDASQASLDPSERLYMLMDSEDQEHSCGTFTIPAGSTAGVEVTGLGFEPDVVILTAARKTSAAAHCQYSVGCVGRNTPDNDRWTYGINVRHGTNPANWTRWREDSCLVMIHVTGAVPGTVVELLLADLDSFDPDGFNLGVSVNGLAADLTVGFLALKGTFKVGTASFRTSTGTQEVSGLGFEPMAVWLASAGVYPEPGDPQPYVRNREGWNVVNGFASVWEGAISEEVMWGGAKKSGAPNWSASRWEHKAIYLGSIGSTSFGTRSAANMDAFLADGFRLNWTQVDGVAYRFGYLATERGEADSFQIVSHGTPTPDVDISVPTLVRPKAMISTSTGTYGLSASERIVVPASFMVGGHGYLGLGANEPWEVGHYATGAQAGDSIPGEGFDEVSSGIAQSSGGPAGGGYPTCKCYLREKSQGFSYWHDPPSGDVATTVRGQAFDVFLRFIVGTNYRIHTRYGVAARALIDPDEF